MSTVGKTKAAEMAYARIQLLKAQMKQTDFNPADDYKGTLMQRPQRIIKRTQELQSNREQQEIMRVAEMAKRIEEGFKTNAKTKV
jgi:hypothetical protein